MIKFDIVPYQKFIDDYNNKLKQPSCLPRHMVELCGGWTQETFKQIIQKITKKNTAPLQLWYDSWQSMDVISIKKASLKEVFRLLDSRNIGRIDSCELFSVMLFIAKGDFDLVLSNITIIFGFKNPQNLTSDEFFYFLDSFFRGISKTLIQNNRNEPYDINKRLSAEDIKEIVQKVYGNNISYTGDQFAQQQSLNNIKITQELGTDANIFSISQPLNDIQSYTVLDG
ncbi:hypothetical protein IMG5_174910 [Ichthyophthirius multifiliis]|uniref:EF-hand domain-containing protein n=1 Tax=Ichthyophthirius multifiliis TaxID=5932 RepID=G0R245_ICHMU|nr:hypothetical protein IMG5_174910 [Ichthyophthirius multifiliis]EGR28452.1 hypothetical protein IMG5_174910 [Ichthyophthirius multifiliis]|eukprot:XP_004029688.1 hypothetical protein IMG5_174910 [Ichthyophthirius multifiliis]